MTTPVHTHISPPPKPVFSTGRGNLLPRKCACGGIPGFDGECIQCRRQRLAVQRKAIDQESPVDDLMAVPASGGAFLGDNVRASMEQRFGASFADVRIHANASAEQAALNLGARAFTHGRDIFFAPGQFQPTNRSGLGLLAHELTHVLQQRNGHFPVTTSSNRVAEARSSLESEAERVERDVQSSTMPLQVREKARGNQLHRSPGLLDELQARVIGSIEALADYVVRRLGAAADAIITELNELRTRLRGLRSLLLSPEVAAELEAIYNRFRASAPSWVPVPNISFAGPPTQQAGPIAIPVAAILLFLAFILVMWWVISAQNPAVRRQRERDVGRAIEAIREALRRPVPKPKPAPPTEEAPPAPESAPKTGPEAEPRTGPQKTTDVFPPLPRAYPLCWATQLGPPTQRIFVRTKGERDEEEAKQARMQLEWRRLRDPDFDPTKYHVHHVVPLFLGGPDDLTNNGTTIPARLHLKGHRVLQIQPQMLTPPPPLRPLPVDIYTHPVGTPYLLVGFKQEPGETCP